MSSILNRLYFKNYKAFSEADIEIKPLTILLGANSSGKSSILQLLLAIEQTINNKDTYSSALKLNGHYVNLGEDINVIKDKKRSNILSIEFGLDDESLLSRFEISFFREFYRYFAIIYPIFDGGKILNQNSPVLVLDNNNGNNNSQYIHEYVNYLESQKNDDIRYSYYNHQFRHSINEYLDDFLTSKPWQFAIDNKIIESSGGDESELIPNINTICSYYLKIISLLKNNKTNLCYELQIPQNSKRMSIRRCYIRINETGEIGYHIQKSNMSSLFSTIKGIDISNVKTNRTSFSGLELEYKYEKNIYEKFVIPLINSAYESLEDIFESDNISYVGPLRAYPQRYYFLDESNSSYNIDAQNGQRLAEILKRDKVLCDKINNWLKDFEIKFSVKELRDIIHNIKVTQNGLKLDITDVGFGYSQILPILVQGFMSENKSLNIIEQPEIHLHPKMQASLADLFIDIIISSTQKKYTQSSDISEQKTFLIETHSEYMLKRLRRRIAEGKISSNDVAIYFIESRNNTNKDSAILKRVNVSQMGDIDWPKDFYITSLDDDIAFLEKKLQTSHE
jgi:predicted ATPase